MYEVAYKQLFCCLFFFEEFAQDIPINRYKYHGTFSLPFFKTRFYNLDVSTQENIFSGGARQLNMMTSLDIGNSYALRRAADAPGSVRIGLMG